jgi:hypothetical protein
VVPDSERMLRAVLDDNRFAPSAPVQRPGPRPDFARAAGFRAITVRSGARRPLQGRTRRGRDAGRRLGPLIGPGCGNLCRPPCPSVTTSFHWAASCAPALSRGPDYLASRPARTRSGRSSRPPLISLGRSLRAEARVQSTRRRADRVRALVGRGPASPSAACLVGGEVVRVTGPGRPKG